MFRSDEAHGERGELPDGFSTEDAEVVGQVPITTHVHDKVPEDERVRCKYCDETFAGYHGLKTHLAMVGENAEHPAGATEEPIEAVGVRVPAQTAEKLAESSSRQQRLAGYRRGMMKLSGHDVPEVVPREPLDDLLDQLREKQTESGAYYQAAKMLADVIEEHAKDDVEAKPTPGRQSDQISQTQ
jgi:hypothetical protein